MGTLGAMRMMQGYLDPWSSLSVRDLETLIHTATGHTLGPPGALGGLHDVTNYSLTRQTTKQLPIWTTWDRF